MNSREGVHRITFIIKALSFLIGGLTVLACAAFTVLGLKNGTFDLSFLLMMGIGGALIVGAGIALAWVIEGFVAPKPGEPPQ